MRRFFASILVIAHIATTLVAPEARAMESESYVLAAGATINGPGRSGSTGSSIPVNSIAEMAAGTATSANFILASGYAGQVKSSPPCLIQNIPYQVWDKGAGHANAFDLDDYFVSTDYPTLEYSVTGNSAVTISIDPSTHVVSFSQGAAFSGVETVRFIATDRDGNSTRSRPVKLLVKGAQNPPLVNIMDDVVASENDLVTLSPTATEVDGQAVTFSYSYPFDGTGKWQTDYNDAGEYTVTITAKDTTGLTDSLDVPVRINNVNRPPVMDHIANITVNEGELVSISPQVRDPDGDPVVVTFASPLNSHGKWQTGFTDHGTYTVTVSASDGSQAVSQDVVVTVVDVAKPPVVTADLSAHVVNKDTQFTISASATDPDGDAMTLKIEKDSTILVDTQSLTGTYQTQTSFSSIGDHTIKVTVTDATGLATVKALPLEVLDTTLDPAKTKPIEGDFNGDGLTDTGIFNQGAGEWKVSLSNGGTFSDRVTWLTAFGASTDWNNIGGDFNGDGRADIGVCNKNTGEFQIALSDGTKFVSKGKVATINDNTYGVPLSGDFNGDGLTDIGSYDYQNGKIRLALSKGETFLYPTTWISGITNPGDRIPILGDFNGDGFTDLALFRKATGEIMVALSDGKKLGTLTAWITGYAANKNLMAGDFNNDGLMDLGYKDDSTGNWYIATSTGTAFQDKGQWQSGFGSGSDNVALTGDFDGDGVTDIATFNKNNSGLAQWNAKTQNEDIPDLLIEIDNGIGGKTSIEYVPSTVYQNPDLPFPLQVVKKVSRIDSKPDVAPQESYVQESKFDGASFDATTREFRGFRKATVTDPITGNYTETYFYQGVTTSEEPLKGQIEKIVAYEISGELISQTVNRYENTIGGTAPNVINFVHLAETTSTVYENYSQLTVTTKFTYDNLGNIVKQVNEGDTSLTGDEKLTFMTYAPAYEYLSADEGGFNKVVESRLEDGDSNVFDKKLFGYDAKGNLLRQENVFLEMPAESPVTTFTYDDYGNALTVTNANLHAVTTVYDTDYHIYPHTISNELGHTITYAYDARSGLVTSITDANGNSATTVYDVLYRKTEERNANDQVVTSYTYPDYNTVVTHKLNLATTEYVDGLGRKYKTVTSGEDGATARQVVSEKFFGDRGFIDHESLPHYIDEDQAKIAYVRYEYDTRGRVTKITNDFPGVLKDSFSTIAYPSVLTKTTTDAKGRVRQGSTDVYGSATEIVDYIDNLPITTHYEYDIKGNLRRLVDTSGNTTDIFYDSLNRKTKIIDPDTGTTTYTYDRMGNLSTQTDNKLTTITFAYDALSRVTRKSYSTGDPAVVYTYDELASTNSTGRLTRIDDASGTLKYYYDKEGRISRTDKIVDGTTYTFQSHYDIFSRVIQTIYPDNETLTYTYDTNSGLLEAVAGNANYAHDFEYNAKGQINTFTLGNGSRTAYTYGDDELLSRIYTAKGSAPIQDLGYVFDSVGCITSITDTMTGVTKTYTYDSLNRLASATNIPDGKGSLGTIFYKYDALGNITYKSDVGEYTYGENGAGPHAVTSIRPAYSGGAKSLAVNIPVYGPAIEGAANLDFQYDANGNMISKVGTVNSPYAGSHNFDIAFTHDAENRLKKVSASGVDIETYVYDHSGQRVKKIDTAGTSVYIGKLYEIRIVGATRTYIKHIFAGQTRVASIETVGASSTTYYYHPDHLGSTNKVSNNSGALVNSVEYTPFGQTASSTFSNGQTTKPTSYLFTGKELDGTGLYYYGARYYDPLIGRFISADPTIARPYDSQDLNRYSYCRNNPLIYTDPSGYSWWSAFWNWVAGFFGAVVGVAVGTATLNPLLGAIAAGAVSGAILGAVNGGIKGALQGAIVGAVAGLALGAGTLAFGPLFATAALIAGGVYEYSQRKWEGVGDYVAGVFGGACGFYAGSALVHGTTNINVYGQPRNSASKSSSLASNSLTTKCEPSDSPRLTRNYGVEGEIRSYNLTYEETLPTTGAKVYRVYDGNPYGSSWTPVDPRTVPGYAKAAGMYNKGRFLIEGTLIDTTGVESHPAFAGPNGRGGGLTEWFIPDPKNQVQVDNVLGLNPEFNPNGY